MKQHANARLTVHGRLLLVQRIRQEGWAVQDAADAGGVSRRTAFKWLARFEESGEAGLLDRSSAPKSIPHRTSEAVEARIEAIRRKIRTGAEIAERLRMALSTVFAVLNRLSLSRLRDLLPKEPIVRYEKDYAGEMIHLDTKRLGRFHQTGHRADGRRHSINRGIGWEFVHVAVDDHSRTAWAEIHRDELGVTAEGALRRMVAWYREQGVIVESVLTDNGGCYLSKVFADACKELDIRHYRTRPYRPQTNGKAERFIQTMLRKWAYVKPYRSSRGRHQALPWWIRYYNELRGHGSLGNKPPISRMPSVQ